MGIIQGLSNAHEPGYSEEKLIHFLAQVMSTIITEIKEEY
jgi:protein-arginine kinase